MIISIYQTSVPVLNQIDHGVKPGIEYNWRTDRLITYPVDWPFNRYYYLVIRHQIKVSMNPKFSEDIGPISDFKVNPDKLVKHVQELHRP